MGRGNRGISNEVAQTRIGVRRGKNFEAVQDYRTKRDLKTLRNPQSYAWMPSDRLLISKSQKDYIDNALTAADANKFKALTQAQQNRFYNAHAEQFDENNIIPGGASLLQEKIHLILLDQVQLPEQYPEEFRKLQLNSKTVASQNTASLRTAQRHTQPTDKKPAVVREEEKEKISAIAEMVPVVPGQSNKKTLKEAATDAHKEWQKNWQLQNGDESRWKDTKDQKWIDKHGTDKVDIAHTDFKNLPKDWQKDNVLGANSAMEAIQEQIAEQLKDSIKFENKTIKADMSTFSKERIGQCSIDIERASEKVHDAWVKRNGDQDWVKEAGLDKPYSELPEAEKEKDRAFVKIVISLMGR